MDILDSANAQQKINDAASQVNPPASSTGGPPPEPPPAPAFTPSEPSSPPPAPTMPEPTHAPVELPKSEEPPKELKEEAILPEKSAVSSPPPPADIPTPSPMAPPAEPDLKPAEPPQSTTFGAPTPKETKPEAPPSPPPPAKKGGVGKGVILGGLLLLLVTLPVAVFYVSQQQQQLTETRSKAAGESCAWCASTPQCPHGTTPTSVCSNGQCCEGYSSGGGGGPAPTSGGGGGGGGTTCNASNCDPAQSNICCPDNTCRKAWNGCGGAVGAAWCTGSSSSNHGECPTTGGYTYAFPCSAGGCGSLGRCCPSGDNSCSACNPAPTGGGPTPSTGLTGNVCNANCCSARTANGFYVQKCTCSSSLTNGRCLDNCVNAGGSACFPDNFCGSMQLDVRTAAGEAASEKGEPVLQLAKNGNGVCGPTPSGCKSDWCTSSADCLSKGGTVGTPASFPSCSPGLVACCGVPNQPTVTPTQPPAVGQCTRIKVYKGTVAVDPKTLKVGDSVVLAVAGTNATKGRIRVNGAAFTETTIKNASGEYTVPFTIPDGVPSFTIEAEVFADNQWK